MKKQRMIAFVLACALFGGCSYRVQPKTKKPKPTPGITSTQPGALAPSATPAPVLTVEEQLRRVLVSYRYDDRQYTDAGSGTLLLDYSCATPVISIPDAPAAQKAIQSVLEKRTETFIKGAGEVAGLDSFLALANEDFAANGGDNGYFINYAMQRRAQVTRADAAVVSIVYADYTNSGGAHGISGSAGLVFDTESGQQLHLDDLSEDADALRAFCLQELRTQSAQQREELYENYEEHLPSLLEDGSWYFTERGLVFVASPYLLAPYAAGNIEFTITYKKLSGLIHERYQRPAKAAVQGGMAIGWANELDFGKQDPLQSLQLAPLSPFCLWAENTVYHVRLSSVVYRDYTGDFEESRALLYASRMDDGEFWRVAADIPDVIPSLMLSWQLPDGTLQRCLITMSGMDGSLSLLDPNSLDMLQPGELRSNQIEYGFLWDFNGDGDAEDLYFREENGSVSLIVTKNGRESIAVTPFSTQPRCFVADVDGDGVFEILLCGNTGEDASTILAWRYQKELTSVDFTVNGSVLSRLTGTILGADASELVLSATIDILGRYTGSCVFGAGPKGTLAPLPGQPWNFSGNEKFLTASSDLRFIDEGGNNGKLCAGTRLRVTSYDGSRVRFETDSGVRGYLSVSGSAGDFLVDGKRVSSAFDGIQ